jgi:hypothetical protein
MNKRILMLGFVSALAVACTLSVSDMNPKPVSLLGSAGLAGATIAGGILSIGGSGLNNVQSLSIRQGSQDVGLTIESKSSSVLRASLPASLILPAMLIATAASAQEFPLNALSALTIEGDATVEGSLKIGHTITTKPCGGGNSLCTADCPAGTRIVTGGCVVTPDGAGIAQNYPSGVNQWACKAGTAGATSTTTHIICARIAE